MNPIARLLSVLLFPLLIHSQAMAASDDSDTSENGKDTQGDGFTIMAGDALEISVWKEDTLDKEVTVLPDGTITFPLIGTVDVEGLTLKAAQSTIKTKLSKFIPDATVSVLVKSALGHSVSILGQVAKPGEVVLAHPTGVMGALSQAGGITPYADTSDIIIIRYVNGKKTSIKFPYDAVSQGHKLEKDIDLIPGDVIVVPTAGLF